MIRDSNLQMHQTLQHILGQLDDSLHQLSDQQYTSSIKKLFNASIGQHVRHIIEFFTCLDKGYATGIVNYEKRERDLSIERDKETARKLLQSILLSVPRADKIMILQANYDEHLNDQIQLETSYFREIAYNLEHTIHHMALIRVGINELTEIQLPQEFGVAPSTIKHRTATAN